MSHPVPRGIEKINMNPRLLETLRLQFEQTQGGSGITFQNYLGQLLETVAVNANNTAPTVNAPTARPRLRHHQPKKNGVRYTEQKETLAAARAIAQDPKQIAEVMRRRRRPPSREEIEYREQVKAAVIAGRMAPDNPIAQQVAREENYE